MPEFTLSINNMHCGSCIRRVTQTLTDTPGVEVKEVTLGSARFSSSQVPAPVDLAVQEADRLGIAVYDYAPALREAALRIVQTLNAQSGE